MPFDQPQEQESRLRVSANLPAGNSDQAAAIRTVIDHIKSLQRRPETGVSGFTHTSLIPAGYRGYWCNSEGQWIADRIVRLYIDFDFSGEREMRLWEELAALKRFIKEIYSRYNSEQDEVWLISHPVDRTV